MGIAFDAATTLRFQNSAEDQFAGERPCIIDRVSLDIVAGTAIYNLPVACISIRRITYMGWKVFPLPHRDLRQSFQAGTQQSRPYWYIFNNIGQSQIRLFPVPSDSLVSITGAALWGSGISSAFIIEYFSLPNQTTLKIPTYFRSRLLTYYSNRRNFSMEGRAQDIKAGKYWQSKFEGMKEVYIELMDDLNNKPRNIVANNESSRPYGFLPPPPVLPISRFGISVDGPGY